MVQRAKISGNTSKIVVWITLAAFVFFVLLPAFYLISYVFLKWDEVWIEVFANPIIGDENWKQIVGVLNFSFRLSLSAVAFDLVFGVPLAYVLARKEFPGKALLEDQVLWITHTFSHRIGRRVQDAKHSVQLKQSGPSPSGKHVARPAHTQASLFR